MSEASLAGWDRALARALVAAFVIALLVTAMAPGGPVAGADLSDEISSNRASQLYSESVMRQADRTLAQLVRQRKATKQKLKQAQRSAKRLRRSWSNASDIVRIRSQRLRDVETKFAELEVVEDPEAWKERLQGLRRDLRIATARRQQLGKQMRATIRARTARKRSLRGLARQRRAAIARRESAEASLGYRIVQMTRLAQLRAEHQSGITLTSDGSTFAWPSEGRISQPYGCTGLRWNPPRGSCRHFHDGLDIVSGYGSPVRAAAVGVVAYVGWNPWDTRGRAFIVVVGHPDGYVTRYGHLLPSRRVRVGQLVRKGQAIGRMGNTGFSTGTHLHLELLRGTTPLDPTAFLPSGVVGEAREQSRKGGARRGKGEGRAHARSGRPGAKAKADRDAHGKANRAGDRRSRLTRASKAARREAARGAADRRGEDSVEMASGNAPMMVFSCETSFPGEAVSELDQADRPSTPSQVVEAVTDAQEASLFCAHVPTLPTPGPGPLVAALDAVRSSVELPSRGTSPLPQ